MGHYSAELLSGEIRPGSPMYLLSVRQFSAAIEDSQRDSGPVTTTIALAQDHTVRSPSARTCQRAFGLIEVIADGGDKLLHGSVEVRAGVNALVVC